MLDDERRCIAVRVQVGWGDCDPAGIVFYPRFYAWMDMSSHVLARAMGIPREAMLPPNRDLLGFPVVATQAQYLLPARLEDVLEVRTWVTRVGRSSLSLRHEVVRVGGGADELLVRGREDRVFIQHAADGTLQPREITPAMRGALAHYAESDSHGLSDP
ncbi:MAG: acyl-CoA thioesterase [Chloroflexota bacterium]|nr:acyl-CoA thioesterase [Chloroflexota bacterium]